MIYLTADLVPSALLRHETPGDMTRRLLEQAAQRRQAGDLRGAERYAQEARLFSQEARAHIDQAAALIHLCDIYREMGKLGPALRSAREAYDILRRQPGLDQRHNEAVAAYNLGLIHHLLGNDVEALNWYQNARQMLELACEYWATRKEIRLIHVCRRLQQWAAELSGSLAHEGGREGVHSLLILPARLVGSGNDQISVAELKVDGFLLGSRLVIGGRLFQVHPLTGKRIVVRAGETCQVFEIPEQVCLQVRARKGDHLLARRTEQWGPGKGFYLLDGGAGVDFGRFHRDDKGEVAFESLVTGRIIGGIRGGDFSVYHPLALLRPIG